MGESIKPYLQATIFIVQSFSIINGLLFSYYYKIKNHFEKYFIFILIDSLFTLSPLKYVGIISSETQYLK